MNAQHKRGVRHRAGAATPAPSAAEQDRKELLKQMRAITNLERKRRALKRQIVAITKELRGRRRGLKLMTEAMARRLGIPAEEWDSAAPKA